MKTNYPGIDYGLGQSNKDKETGIRNGVIPFHEVTQAWCDSSVGHYGKPEECDCPECDKTFAVSGIEWGAEVTCEHCGHEFDCDLPDMAEPLSHYYEAEGYACEQGNDSPDIFVCRSPYFTYAQFCSPCAPGACYLLNPLEQESPDNRCFCLGHDWFDGGVAPYPVYSVETGKPVESEVAR